jgi:RNA exonuclease 4
MSSSKDIVESDISVNPAEDHSMKEHFEKGREATPSRWSPRSHIYRTFRPCPKVVSPERQIPGFPSFMAHRFLALDCEMVGVGPGGMQSVLARVSLVDFFGNCLFDTFVRVEERVTDFRTHVSGVHASDLESPKAMSFGKCRRLVKEMIRNKILVGHGLPNDFTVLGIDHPWYNIRDTSLYQPYMKVDHFGNLRPCRLRDLARVHLAILIQQEGRPHNSMEDACAAMALYRNVQVEWDYAMDCQRRNLVLQTPLHNYLPAY